MRCSAIATQKPGHRDRRHPPPAYVPRRGRPSRGRGPPAFLETAILVVSQYVEQTYATELLADGNGGVGYLLKDRVMDVADFVDAVRRVAAGGTALDPEVVSQLFAPSARRPARAVDAAEREVLGLMAEGRSNAGIAEQLVLTVGAVEKHIASILQKLRLPPSESDSHRRAAVLTHLQNEPES